MTAPELSFGSVRLWPHRRELQRDGAPVKLSSRGFEVLLALLERPGEVLTRRELIERVWSGRVVEDANLSVQVSQLRRRLGADGSAIRTEPGRGFRFVGELRSTAAVGTQAGAEPAPSSLGSGPLPERLGVLIGREAALDAIDLDVDAGRVVTLVGPGGIGKTRLAIEAARRCRPRFADGVFIIDLVPLGDVGPIVAALAAAVGAASAHGTTLDNVLQPLRDRSLLILFDNCEHVIEAAAHIVSALLTQCPRIAVLATSREPLRIDNERVFAVPPLALAPDEAIARGDALRFPATQLFIDRVRSAKPAFEPAAAELAEIGRVCRHLDGMPLAIELAAGRVPSLGVDRVAARLRDGLQILSGGRRSSARRHLTLQATLAWSHDLLAPAEQVLFRRLAVFPHTFTLPVAEAVLASPELSDWDIVDAVEALVTKSLLVAEDDEGAIRYRMLETTKAYAVERLSMAGESDALSQRLAGHVRGVSHDAERDYRMQNGATWLKRYGSELPNLRATLEWAFGESGDRQLGIETAVYSWPIWRELALVEGQQWLARAEALLNEQTDAGVRALLWSARGWLLPNVRNPEAAENFRRAISAFGELDDDLRLGEALRGLGQALSLTGKTAEGYPILVQARALIEKSGAPCSLAACLESMAQSLHIEGRHDESRGLYGAALELFRSLGAERQSATVLNNLGDLSYNMGDIDAAIDYTAAATDQLRRSGISGSHLAVGLGNLSGFYIARGDTEAACRTAAEALPLLAGAGMDFWFFDHLAALAALLGDFGTAARLLGYSDAAYARQNDYRQPSEQKAYEMATKLVSEAIGPARLHDLLMVGRSWTQDDAVARAKQLLLPAQQPKPGTRSALRG